jgi:uncharacterized phage protein (TIGR01671 family)
MRKLKFRIWNKTDKHLTQPHAISQELIENDNLVIMQFTGLLDKRGVEIYEGDVVRATTRGATFTTKQGIIEWVDYLKALGVHIFDEDIDDSKPVGSSTNSKSSATSMRTPIS